MELTSRETWTVIHGLILGSLFLPADHGASVAAHRDHRHAGRRVAAAAVAGAFGAFLNKVAPIV